MQEVKRPKKPLIYFYVAMILAILVFNCLVAPYLARKAIEDVDYGTFMTMTENGEIGKVQIQQNQIVFTDKEESAIYRTGVIEDPGLVERLHASGATLQVRSWRKRHPWQHCFCHGCCRSAFSLCSVSICRKS